MPNPNLTGMRRALAKTAAGRAFLQASHQRLQMVIFFRHGRCPFLARTLHLIRQARPHLEKFPVEIHLIHMLEPVDFEHRLEQWGLSDVSHQSDPYAELYQCVGLPRANLWQVAGPRVWPAGTRAICQGYLPGRAGGDLRQMPGVVLISNGEIRGHYAARRTDDFPDLVKLVESLDGFGLGRRVHRGG